MAISEKKTMALVDRRFRKGPRCSQGLWLLVVLLFIYGLAWQGIFIQTPPFEKTRKEEEKELEDAMWQPTRVIHRTTHHNLTTANTLTNNDTQSATKHPLVVKKKEETTPTTKDRPSYHPVQLRPEEVFMWKGRQRKLCKRIQTSEHTKLLLQKERILLYFGMQCQALHEQNRHGNYIYGIYAMHVATLPYYPSVDLTFLCQEENRYDQVFWWLQSYPSHVEETRKLLVQNTVAATSTSNGDTSPSSLLPLPDTSQACAGMGKIPLEYTVPLATRQLRQMALSIFGAKHLKNSRHSKELETGVYVYDNEESISSSNKTDKIPSPQSPLYPDVELDSIAIHFRCGDVLGNLVGGKKGNYGLLSFPTYRQMLERILEDDIVNNATTSIGIVTAPFQNAHHLRSEDSKYASRCQTLVEMLQSYLTESFANQGIPVFIRNSPKDTIPMVYSRLILASQGVICIRSTFCTYPAVASFAKHRILLQGGVNYFVHSKPNEGLYVWPSDQAHYIYSHELHHLGWKATKAWLRQPYDWKTNQTKS